MFSVFRAGVTLLSSSNNHQFVLHLTFLVEVAEFIAFMRAALSRLSKKTCEGVPPLCFGWAQHSSSNNYPLFLHFLFLVEANFSLSKKICEGVPPLPKGHYTFL